MVWMIICFDMRSYSLVGVLLSVYITMSGMARCRVAESGSEETSIVQ